VVLQNLAIVLEDISRLLVDAICILQLDYLWQILKMGGKFLMRTGLPEESFSVG
jgi:hypothetical protein